MDTVAKRQMLGRAGSEHLARQFVLEVLLQDVWDLVAKENAKIT